MTGRPGSFWPGILRAAVLLGLLFCRLLATPTLAAQTGGPSEYEVKAFFLLNFLKFVDAGDQQPDRSVLLICLIGDDPFGPIIDESLSGREVNRRRVVLERRSDGDPAEDCDLAFLHFDNEALYLENLRPLRSKPVLVVHEERSFSADGGIINLLIRDGKVAFEVNLGAAKRAGLEISSKLLQLAVRVAE